MGSIINDGHHDLLLVLSGYAVKKFQVNLEYLGQVVFKTDGILYSDRVVGIDLHTTVIDGVGVVGLGVGGIETVAAMLGQVFLHSCMPITTTTSTMKLLVLLFSAFFLLSSLATLAAAEVVLDTDGNELRRGVEYYIYPGITDVAGGLTLASRNNSCPLDVALAISPTSNGLPLTFLPADPKVDTINTLMDLNIVFSAVTICVQSTVWKLDFDDTARRYYVTTAGVTGNPGRETLSNWFEIDSDRGGYKLVFCPTVCDICRPVCGNLGVYEEDGRRWLGIDFDAPLPVQFRRA